MSRIRNLPREEFFSDAAVPLCRGVPVLATWPANRVCRAAEFTLSYGAQQRWAHALVELMKIANWPDSMPPQLIGAARNIAGSPISNMNSEWKRLLSAAEIERCRTAFDLNMPNTNAAVRHLHRLLFYNRPQPGMSLHEFRGASNVMVWLHDYSVFIAPYATVPKPTRAALERHMQHRSHNPNLKDR